MEKIRKAFLTCLVIESTRILALTVLVVLFGFGRVSFVLVALSAALTYFIGFAVCTIFFSRTMRLNLKGMIPDDAYEEIYKYYPLATFHGFAAAFSNSNETADMKLAKKYFVFQSLLPVIQFCVTVIIMLICTMIIMIGDAGTI